ncbi:MAG: hypothetical protein P8Y70_16615 [Candidatus Lokiarchaeota archaeon]
MDKKLQFCTIHRFVEAHLPNVLKGKIKGQIKQELKMERMLKLIIQEKNIRVGGIEVHTIT